MPIKSFEDLKVWQESVEMADKINNLIVSSDLKSDYALRDQIKRASISISSNIAEGFERNNNKDFRRFLYYSKGSAGEVRSQLFLAYKFGYITEESYDTIKKELVELGKQLKGFISYLANWGENKK